MSCDRPPALACLGCGADLSWQVGPDVRLTPDAFAIAAIDGVPIRGGVDRDDPRYELTRFASPFCRACYDARMTRAVELPRA